MFAPPNTMNIGSMIRYTSDLENLACKIMLYGLAGVGKTRILRTLPQPLIISTEGGLLSLRKEKLPFLEVKDMVTMQAAYEWLRTAQDQWAFRSIGLDSASDIAEVVLAAEMKNNKDPRKAYGEMATQMMNLLRGFRDLPYRHVVFTMKQGRITDQQTGGIMWGPLMPGQQLDQQVPYMFDEVFHLGNYRDQQGVEFSALRTRGDNQYQAKDRSGALETWEPPDLNAVLQKIMKG